MKKILFLLTFLFVFTLSSCSNQISPVPFEEDTTVTLEPLLTVSSPIFDDNDEIIGYDEVPVDEIDWKVKYESDLYSIFYRDVPEDMIFYMYGLQIEDGKCFIGHKDQYQYVIFYEENYYEFYEFYLKYNNLTCDFLSDIGIFESEVEK